MKLKTITLVALAVAALAACSDTTDTIGSSLSEQIDAVSVETATFNVASRSIVADSVLSRNTTGYVGRVRDPETGAYVKGDFMAQFFCLEDFALPEKSELVTYDEQGNEVRGIVKADSCELRLFYSSFYGDSTNTMKLTAHEMSHPMNEDRNYYSNFDPIKEGYIRDGGIHKDKVYTLTDFNVSESRRDTATYEPYITIKLNDPYTDTDGRTYDNYGTYVMQKYYDNTQNFKNAYTFRNNVVPGFYFANKAGLGSMAYIDGSQLNVYYKFFTEDTVVSRVDVYWGTEEVLQKTNITNDKATIEKLAADESCTYLKTPAGIFTELTLPVEDIVRGHADDNIAGARLVLQRINNTSASDFTFNVPKTVLMIPKDSLYSFFEHNDMYDNRTSYVASWSYSSSSATSGNAYTFSNISGMIKAMADINEADRSSDWNKVVLVPVTLTTSSTSNSSSSYYYSYYSSYYSSSSSSSTVTKVSHDMSLTSTRLVKGTATDSPIKLDVIYSKFK